MIRSTNSDPKSNNFFYTIALVIFCIFLNFVGTFLVDFIHLPIYLDCIGTILSALIGGYIPGIIVGLSTSFLKSIIVDPDSISYGVLNVFMALFTVKFFETDGFKNVKKLFISAIVYTFIGGFIGGFITWSLYGFASEATTSELVLYLFENFHFSDFQAEILGDFLIDLLDKIITVLLVYLIYTPLPQNFKNKFIVNAWMQKPLTNEAKLKVESDNIRRRSLKTKIFLSVSVACVLIGAGAIIISYLAYKESVQYGFIVAGIEAERENIIGASVNYLIKELTLFIGLFILIVAIILYLAEYQIILPLNSMAYTASKFSDVSYDKLKEIANLFEQLDIHTGDETENLYKAITNLTRDNVRYIDAINKQNATITDMQGALIIVLADMVESRDHTTGNHVKTTAEYVKIILDEMLREGIYADRLTPEYMFDVYYAAPLHDIGKLAVSDVILNKPGKLTEEEFDIMKTHTTVGAQIIDKVMETMPQNNNNRYLQVARKLALCHHERWDGTGYPNGLSKDGIPLSARIMAVADVFDALVSDRSYKKAMPFEEAIDIIRESSGSHFDPLIVQAFLNAEDKIRQVTENKGND